MTNKTALKGYYKTGYLDGQIDSSRKATKAGTALGFLQQLLKKAYGSGYPNTEVSVSSIPTGAEQQKVIVALAYGLSIMAIRTSQMQAATGKSNSTGQAKTDWQTVFNLLSSAGTYSNEHLKEILGSEAQDQ